MWDSSKMVLFISRIEHSLLILQKLHSLKIWYSSRIYSGSYAFFIVYVPSEIHLPSLCLIICMQMAHNYIYLLKQEMICLLKYMLVCLNEVKVWLSNNFLQVNERKSEIVIFKKLHFTFLNVLLYINKYKFKI